MYGNEKREKENCKFCEQDVMGRGGEFRRCSEEERCFDKTFECRERKIVECRLKEGGHH